jgi:RNA polymerase sigma factor (sigma-70 family)
MEAGGKRVAFVSDDLEFLVTAAKQGDREAYGELVARFSERALAAAYVRLRDFQLAQDAVQETFLAAWLDLASLREPGAFPGWLRKILLKQCDRLARRPRLPTVPLESAGDVPATDGDPLGAALRDALQAEVRAALHALSEAQRQAVVLYYGQGFNTGEIARALQIPVSAVKKRLYDARRKLGEKIVGLFDATGSDHERSREERPDHPVPDGSDVDLTDGVWTDARLTYTWLRLGSGARRRTLRTARREDPWMTMCRACAKGRSGGRSSFWARRTGASPMPPGRPWSAPASRASAP